MATVARSTVARAMVARATVTRAMVARVTVARVTVASATVARTTVAMPLPPRPARFLYMAAAAAASRSFYIIEAYKNYFCFFQS